MTDSSTLKSLALECVTQGRFTESFDLAAEAARLDPNDIEPIIIAGFCLYRVGINEMAYMWLKKALKSLDRVQWHHNSLYKKAHECLGRIAYSCKRDYDEATAHLTETLGADADDELNP